MGDGDYPASRVFRLEVYSAVFVDKSFQGNFVPYSGKDDVAGLIFFFLFYQHLVSVVDAGLDHRIAADLNNENILIHTEPRRYRSPLALLYGFDGGTGGSNPGNTHSWFSVYCLVAEGFD